MNNLEITQDPDISMIPVPATRLLSPRPGLRASESTRVERHITPEMPLTSSGPRGHTSSVPIPIPSTRVFGPQPGFLDASPSTSEKCPSPKFLTPRPGLPAAEQSTYEISLSPRSLTPVLESEVLTSYNLGSPRSPCPRHGFHVARPPTYNRCPSPTSLSSRPKLFAGPSTYEPIPLETEPLSSELFSISRPRTRDVAESCTYESFFTPMSLDPGPAILAKRPSTSESCRSPRSVSPRPLTPPPQRYDPHIATTSFSIPPSLNIIPSIDREDEDEEEVLESVGVKLTQHAYVPETHPIQLRSSILDVRRSSLNLIEEEGVPVDGEDFESSIHYLETQYKVASVTPTNLSPLPRSPSFMKNETHFDEKFESMQRTSDHFCSLDNLAKPETTEKKNLNKTWRSVPRFDRINLQEEDKKNYIKEKEPNDDVNAITSYYPQGRRASGLPPIVQECLEFTRPIVAALEPRCTCMLEHPALQEVIESVPWVHRQECAIFGTKRDSLAMLVENGDMCFAHKLLIAGEIPACSLLWRMPDETATAKYCLRVESQPSKTPLLSKCPVAHYFSQYTGFRSVRMTADEKVAFITYSTDDQNHSAWMHLEGVTVPQMHRIRITKVPMERAVAEIHGERRRSITKYFTCCCCKKGAD